MVSVRASRSASRIALIGASAAVVLALGGCAGWARSGDVRQPVYRYGDDDDSALPAYPYKLTYGWPRWGPYGYSSVAVQPDLQHIGPPYPACAENVPPDSCRPESRYLGATPPK